MSQQKFSLTVNGQTHAVEADPDMPLLYALRNDVGLNNPHFGCGLAQCGACTVHLDGQPIRSSFLKRTKNPSDEQIRDALSGLKCRCGTHVAILRAVKRAAEMMG